ncbi:WG repeat-containing protein [Elizabethkingia argentiflava]|uniref:WG repeat-containing protein n=2 Tax=Elizabethkingia argenteiflava TaxID=2681556 RepID=A0A845PYU6_9FLAO|nr:WG repeat-containing protein [Elizabethkingia argenteiflava]
MPPDKPIPELIPFFKNGKFGYINIFRKVVIPQKFDLALFFKEDCNLLQAADHRLRKFGSMDYATVEINGVAYRINREGKIVYRYRAYDLGRCITEVQIPAYITYEDMTGHYGLAKKDGLGLADTSQVYIPAQYQYLYVMDSEDIDDPMIIAIRNNKYGVIDKHNNIVIDFKYEDIKKNLSWKEAHLFEVSKDGRRYFFMDKRSNIYSYSY